MAGSLILSRSPVSHFSAYFWLIVPWVFQIIILSPPANYFAQVYIFAKGYICVQSFLLTGEACLNSPYPVGQQKNIEFSQIKPCRYFQLQSTYQILISCKVFSLTCSWHLLFIQQISFSHLSLICHHLLVLRSFQECFRQVSRQVSHQVSGSLQDLQIITWIAIFLCCPGGL